MLKFPSLFPLQDEMVTMQQPISVNRDSSSGSWQHRSSTLSSLDGLPPRRHDYLRITSYDCHSHITNRGMKRNSEALQRSLPAESFTASFGVMGPPQQLVDGPASRSTNLRQIPPTATSEGEYALTERLRSGGSGIVSKSTSSASDSSASSSSTNTTTSTTTTSMSGESLDSTRSSSPAAGTPKVKHSPKRAVDRGSTELVKTDSIDKRLTRWGQGREKSCFIFTFLPACLYTFLVRENARAHNWYFKFYFWPSPSFCCFAFAKFIQFFRWLLNGIGESLMWWVHFFVSW